MTEIKEFWRSLNKIYFCNIMLATSVVASIIMAFTIQFKVENLQDKMVNMQTQIATYKDQISLLEVEWTYLTRPNRLRTLANRYLNR